MRNIKLQIEYDGTDFFGWQIQPEYRTVQGEIEKALLAVIQEPVRLTAAGRTDTGVHAKGQIANFFTQNSLACERIKAGTNANLPFDIRIMAAEQVSDDFDARFSARSRAYTFTIYKKPHAIARQYGWYVSVPLDVTAMNNACKVILGEHDFQAFCQTNAVVDHYLCNVVHAEWKDSETSLTLSIKANRFLHNMVRILVGTFCEIGRGKMEWSQLNNILESRDRTQAGPTVPPHGLVLQSVDYSGPRLY